MSTSMWSFPPWIRDSLRPLVRQRGVSLVILFTLALGVGVNSGILSIFDQLLLRPLPVPSPEQLYALSSPGPKPGWNSHGEAGGREMTFSHPMLKDLRQAPAAHRGLAGFRHARVNLAMDDGARPATAALVTSNYFDVLAVSPARGRLFVTDDFGAPGEGSAVVVSHAWWQREVGGDPGVIGRSLTINDQRMQIVAVAPAGFVGVNRFDPVDVFVPLTRAAELGEPNWALEPRDYYWLYLFTRLAPGAGSDEVAGVLEQHYRNVLRERDIGLAQNVSDEWRNRFLDKSLRLESIARGQSRSRADMRMPLLMLVLLAGGVLAVACVNVSNLLLAMTVSQRGDTAMQMALGAGRRQLAARLLTGLLAIGLIGTLASIPVAWLTIDLALHLMPDPERMPLRVGLDASLVGGAAALSLAAMLLAGLLPLRQAMAASPARMIQEHGSRAGEGRRVGRLRSMLVAGQIALAVSLLLTSGLFVRSLLKLGDTDLGMQVDRVATFTLAPARGGYDAQRAGQLFTSLLERLEGLPGVTSAGMALVPLLGDRDWTNSVRVEGFEPAPGTRTQASFNAVGGRYLGTLSIPLLAGRGFTEADSAGRPRVALVNRAFARQFGLGADAVGKRMAEAAGSDAVLDIEIVGMVADAHFSTIRNQPPAQYFLPLLQQRDLETATFYVRTRGDPAAMLDEIPAVVAALDSNLPVEELTTLKNFSQRTLVRDRLVAVLAVSFAALSTVLAAVGMFGMLRFAIARRTGELGLRAALGATPVRLTWSVLRQALVLAVAGIVPGLVLAGMLGRLAGGLLYGVAWFDWQIALAGLSCMLLITLIAGWLPARRAARVHPVQALRHE